MKKSKPVYLILNEFKKENYDSLLKNISPDNKIITISNLDANKFISDILTASNSKGHRFFFIDPWGYTQINTKTYAEIFNAEQLDFLIFIPIYHIYRFLRKEDDSKQLIPIANFLSDIGISEEDAKASSKIVDFAEKIKLAIAKKANTQYAYYKMLKSAKNNSQYALFFSTKHILGAEKFLEALDKIEEKDLFENTISDKDNAFIKMISSKKKLNNCDLHKYGLLSSLLPKRVNIILKELEKNENIIVFPKIKNRRKGNFYIGYKYCKKRPRLEIEFK